MTAIVGQLDLFAADVEHEPSIVPAPAAIRAAWMAQFQRAPWQPYHSAHDPACAGREGWMCPACGLVELNGFLLNVNHGYDPEIPGRAPGGSFGEWCTRQQLLASQEASRLAREAKAAGVAA